MPSGFEAPLRKTLAVRERRLARRPRSRGARQPIAADALLWLLLASLAVSSARAATLELVPSATALQPGDTLTVDVMVGGLGKR